MCYQGSRARASIISRIQVGERVAKSPRTPLTPPYLRCVIAGASVLCSEREGEMVYGQYTKKWGYVRTRSEHEVKLSCGSDTYAHALKIQVGVRHVEKERIVDNMRCNGG